MSDTLYWFSILSPFSPHHKGWRPGNHSFQAPLPLRPHLIFCQYKSHTWEIRRKGIKEKFSFSEFGSSNTSTSVAETVLWHQMFAVFYKSCFWNKRSYKYGMQPTWICSLPGSSDQGILQARTLEWVAVHFSRGSSQPRDWTQVSNPGLLHCRWILDHLSHEGNPRKLDWVAYPFSRIFPTKELYSDLLHYRRILYQLGYQGNPQVWNKCLY